MVDTIQAQVRKAFGKGASRQLRRDNRTPAVLYGSDQAPLHIHFDAHEIFMHVRYNANALLKIDVAGATELALVKDIQRNPLSRIIEHIDFLRVKADQKVEVNIPVILEGEPVGNAVASVELMTIDVAVPANEIPEHIVVNVAGLEDGTTVRVADLQLPGDVEALSDSEEPVVVVAVPQLDVPEAEGEAAAE
ncbi:50S ribosomal protein L25/general stress protein Ctc [Arcanobacterium hippocoleae]|uniref:Large ribosomal subunit protein bL25 n=1 Tax=Arcanobacterium hippocoleae TaxID=149017 RepID=A0ABU1T3N9_9ACTO|nr:50S ribosomal protein L25/general stress protein Ctc [Arcanobacterium hippocoleae]MDR6939845.1 large subunit ribosomal protein L25 [Arcanobacterium hippocoleae]